MEKSIQSGVGISVPKYISIPGHVFSHEQLSPVAKLIFGQIDALCMKSGYCWATNETLASTQGISTRTASRAVSQLEEFELITTSLEWKQGRSYRTIQVVRNPTPANLESNPVDKNVYTPLDKSGKTPRQKCLPPTPNLVKPLDKNGVHNNHINNQRNNHINNQLSFSFFVGNAGITHARQHIAETFPGRIDGYYATTDLDLFETCCDLFDKKSVGITYQNDNHFIAAFDKQYNRELEQRRERLGLSRNGNVSPI